MSRPMTRALVACMVAALSLSSGCANNKATGDRQFNLLSTQREIALGKEAAPEFEKSYGGSLRDGSIVDYVQRLGHALAEESERPGLPWEFHVVDSSVVNAFALPGGQVFVSRGLLEQLHSEAELAGVLGHEIGHVTAQHIGQQMSQQLALVLATTAVGVIAEQQDEKWLQVLGVGTQVGGAVYLLKFSRDQELEADALGMRYMVRLGYDPAAQRDVLKMLGELDHGDQPPEILSTHPTSRTRVAQVDELMKTTFKGKHGPRQEQRYEEVVLARLDELPAAHHGKDDSAAAAESLTTQHPRSGPVMCTRTPQGWECDEMGTTVSE